MRQTGSAAAGAQMSLKELARTLRASESLEWDRLPDIGLYMDQLVGFLEHQLAPSGSARKERLVTPSMINNYIKGGLIPRAVSRKYSREHIAMLIVVGTLKQVMSVPDLTRLLSGTGKGSVPALYESFRAMMAASREETAILVEGAEGESAGERGSDLRRLALELAMEAQVRSLAARNILAMLAPEQTKPGKREKASRREKTRQADGMDDPGKDQPSATER